MYFSGIDAPDQRNVISELVALSTDMVLNQVRRVDFRKLPYQHLMGEDSNTIEEEYRQKIHMIKLERRASWRCHSNRYRNFLASGPTNATIRN